MSYVVRLPVDELKIDRSFVMGMVGDPTMLTVVRSTIELGHSLGLRVVAEGVEDEATLVLLRELGCDQAQGYFLSRPVSAAKLEEWLAGSAWGRGRPRDDGQCGRRRDCCRGAECLRSGFQNGLTTASTTIAISSRLGASLKARYHFSECRFLSSRNALTRLRHQTW